MSAKTVKIINPTIKGIAGERRVPLSPVDTAGRYVELVAPKGWFPCTRAGIVGKWQIVFTRTKTGENVWRNV